MKKMILRAVFGALIVLTIPAAHAQQAAWLDDDLAVRKEITLRPGAGGAGLDSRTVLLPFAVRLSSQTFAFDQAKPDGADIRVAGPDGQRVDHYVENFDAKAGLATIWVKGVNLDPAGQQVYHLYYGGDVASTANPSAVFDASEMLALDFTGNGPAKDRTRNNNVSTSVPTSAGFAGQSATFSGNESMLVTNSPSLTIPGRPFTFMLWVKPSGPSTGRLVERSGSFTIALNGLTPVATIGGVQIAAAQPLAAGSWSHVALVARGNGRFELYVNGALAGSGQGALPAQQGDLALGLGFAGQIDNVRFAAADRSPGYIRAIQSDNGRGLVTFGAEQARTGHFDVSYFVTVVANVTLEGWIVIGLCMILLVLAIAVMVQKFALVGRVERQNRAFERAYASAGGIEEPGLADTAAAHKSSTLSELYRACMVEVANHTKGGTATFKSSGIEALRARIDAVASNQAYSLSDRLVILTLSIAGGPFLGLLGTVIGVMITFAAIAAEGNVNVNAIAPGVAAALLATAAGLAVAIPALFGYNLILTRIKRINAINRAFADTLVARIADQYGE